MTFARYHVGDTRDVVAAMPEASVDLVVTSPPFLALRSYLPADHPDKHREIGSEPTPAEFLDTLLGLTAEWRRVLAEHGSIAVELGDTYSGSTSKGGPPITGTGSHNSATRGDWFDNRRQPDGWPLAKSLALIPELYRIALAYGVNPLTGQPSPAGRWRIRNVVRWVRPNPPVGALGDKFRPATTDIVVACVSAKRWFDLDAVRVPMKEHSLRYWDAGSIPTKGFNQDRADGGGRDGSRPPSAAGAPPLDWWNIPPGGYRGAHYAVYPPELVAPLIDSMCPRQVCTTCGQPSRRIEADTWTDCGHNTWRPGHVLDPFAGTGTTLAVANGHSRDATGIDIDPRNLDLARERCGLFLEEVMP